MALLAGGVLLSASFEARSATETWNPGGAGDGNGTWDTVSDNWSPGQTVWTDSNDAVFSGTGGTVTLVNPIANSLTFSASGSYFLESGTLTLSGSDVTVNSNATISSAIISDVGLLETGAGTLTLTGSDNFGGATVDVEFGTLAIQNGGAVSGSTGYIGNNPGSSGTVTVSGTGSTWTSSGGLEVGVYGTGTLTITNGGAVSNNGLGGSVIAIYAGSSGTVTVSGTGSIWTSNGDLNIGVYGTGTLTITNGGAVSEDYNSYIGYYPGSSGTVMVSGSGSTWTSRYDLTVGFYYGTGTLTITNGGTVSDEYGLIGYNVSNNPGSSGTVMVSGTGSTWSSFDGLSVGDSGTGTLTITDGGAVSVTEAYYAFIGNNAGSSGTVTVSGSGSTLTSYLLYVGVSGTGTFIETGGLNLVHDVLDLGHNAGGSGTYDLSGGTLNTSAVTGGSGTSIFNFNGGTLQASGSNTTFMTGLTTANVQAGGVLVDTQGFAVTIEQPLLHDTTPGAPATDGGLTKIGSGTLTLTALDTYTGATIVNNGTLVVSGSLSATASMSVTNATVDLSHPNVINSAARVTFSNGVLNVQNNLLRVADLVISGNSTLDLGVSSSSAIVTFAASGADIWSGSLTVLDWNGDLLGGGPDEIFFGSTSSGLTDAQLAEIQFVNPTVNGVAETGSYSAGILSDGEVVATAVPEPGTWGLFVSGIAILIAIRRGRKRSVEA